LVLAIAREGRIEEELYLTTFLVEEGKHTELFSRFLHEVAGSPSDLNRFHVPSYKTIFYEELPATMERLLTDTSSEALARASVTYNMIVEGVLAETGYHSYHGVYLLSRLVAEQPDVWDVIEARMQELFSHALGVVTETFEQYEGGVT